MSDGPSDALWSPYRRRRFKKNRALDPITSYGIILYTSDTPEPKFLLYRRRDTFEYIDFLRGGWYSEEQLPQLFSMMTVEERTRIRQYTLPELWDDLWVEHDCKIYRDGYSRAKRKYDSVRDKIPDLIDGAVSRVSQPPMGWPKGKKNNIRETPIDCALREFHEETHLLIDRSNLRSDRPYIENFRGGNGKSYRTYYYLASVPREVVPPKMLTPHCIRPDTISEEAADLHWLTFSEACANLNYRRQALLSNIVRDIRLRTPPGF